MLVAVAGESNNAVGIRPGLSAAGPGLGGSSAVALPEPSGAFRSLPRLIRASLVATAFVTLRSSAPTAEPPLAFRLCYVPFGFQMDRYFLLHVFPLIMSFFRALQYVKL